MRTLQQVGPTLPGVARQAIATWLASGRHLSIEQANAPPAPVFVTLRNADGSLRGCIGTLTATQPDVLTETVHSAVLAATNDSRFPAVVSAELAALSVEVSVLLGAEPAATVADLDPGRYGVIVSDPRGRQGVLLPNVEGIHDGTYQVAVARHKAGIDPAAPVTLQRFEVLKFAG